MAYTEGGLPFAGGSHESFQAAVRADSTRQTKTRAYLRLLYGRGPTTDHEAASALKVPLSSVCSIRNGAIHAGLVEKGSTTKRSPYGGNRCRNWLLTRSGWAALRALTEQG